MAKHKRPRSPVAIKQRLDHRRGYHRILLGHLIWPMLAVLLIGGIGSLLVPQNLSGIWFVLISLVVSGGFLSLPRAIILGGVIFASATPFLFFMQSDDRLSGELFLLVALLPFAPLFLAVTRAQQIRATRLYMLLNLPQVRAATDVSDWSLLPKPRAIDQRLKSLESSNEKTPAILLKVYFPRMSEALLLLGEVQLQQSVLALADDLRLLLRVGDMIVEDIRAQNVLYVLAFHNAETPDSLGAILRRLNPALRRTGLELSLSYAFYPENGKRLHAMEWSPVELP